MRILLFLVTTSLAFAGAIEDFLDRASPRYSELVSELKDQGYVAKFGDDAKWRPLFVGLQGEFERLLALDLQSQRIINLTGIIHTPMPTTPLCKKPNQPIEGNLVADEIKQDLARAQTVLDRSIILRQLLTANGRLFVVYPKGGLEKRSSDQQRIYLQEVARFPTLYDKQVSQPLPEHLVGATYRFNTPDGLAMFSLRARQANAPEDSAPWEMWCGLRANRKCAIRLDSVDGWINKHSKSD